MMMSKERPYQVTLASELQEEFIRSLQAPEYPFRNGSTMTGGDKIAEISTLITAGTHEDISNEDIDYDTSTRVC